MYLTKKFDYGISGVSVDFIWIINKKNKKREREERGV